MPSIGHVAIGMAAARYDRRVGATRWTLFSAMVVWSALSLLPDADVVGFHFGVAYGDPLGHRGASHSLAFAALGGCAIGLVARALHRPALRTGILAALVLASHGLLDTLTDGGLGCALLWPFSDERFFAPWRPLPVAPIGRAFLSSWGLRVALWEAAVFAPFFLYALWPRARHELDAAEPPEPRT
jgi:inner membrane protein